MADYRMIKENSVVSEHYEIKRLIRGETGRILYLKNANVYLVLAGDILWKINSDGYIEDALRNPGRMHGSGLSLQSRGYVDWVYTGERRIKKYPKIIDARGLSDGKLFALLDRAEVVEFRTSGKDAFVYLWSKGKMKILNISDRDEKVDTRCDRYMTGSYFHEMHWELTCLEGYKKKYDEVSMIQLGKHIVWPGSDHNRVSVDGFNRIFYYFEEGFWWWAIGNILKKTAYVDYPVGPPRSYWYGNVLIRLSHFGEELRFKILGSKQERGIYTENSFLYDLSHTGNDGLSFIQISSPGVSENLRNHYQNSMGFYTVRRRKPGAPEENPVKKGSAVPVSPSDEIRVGTPWTPIVSGFPRELSSQEHPIFGEVRFPGKNGDKRYFVSSSFAVEEKFYVLPELLLLRFRAFAKSGNAFRISTGEGGSIYWIYNPTPDQELDFELQYDREELRSAFRDLEGAGKMIYLETHMESADESVATLSLYLKNGERSIPLKKTHLRLQEPVFEGDRGKEFLRFQRSKLKIEFQRAMEKSEALQDFTDLAKQLSADRSNTMKLQEHINYYVSELLRQYLSQRMTRPARELVRGYFEIIPPDVRRDRNTSVIASNILVLSILSRDEKLAEAMFEKILGPDFRMETESYPILLFNIACYHSFHGRKEKMLVAMRHALKRGKKPEEFLEDEDFRNYWKDKDFLAVLSSYH